MKECKIVHIHDGNPVEISNGNRFFREDFLQTEQVINDYLNQGFEVNRSCHSTRLPFKKKEISLSTNQVF